MKKTNPDLQVHPFADLFPMIEGAEFAALVADLKQHKLRDPIVLFGGKILDGRNRYKAIRSLDPTFSPKTEPACFVEFPTGRDALAFVLSKNLARRHLTESQRAMVAADIETLRQGERRAAKDANLQVSRDEAARLLKVSERSIASAKVVRAKGAPELRNAVKSGFVAVSTAEQLAELPAADQAEIVARGKTEILKAAKSIMAEQREKRRDERFAKIAEISKGNTALPVGDRKYPVIYIDPPWKFESGFGDRSVENHYPTMTVDEICAMPVGELAQRDAVLFMWVTIPHLMNANRVLEAWGFEYKSSAAWDKVDGGHGHWFFNQHEILLVATRGSFPAPAPVVKARSLYREKKTDHSSKPSYYVELIERMTPGLDRVEIFARIDGAPLRPGWSAWGNQAKPSLPESAPIAQIAQSIEPVDPLPIVSPPSDADLEIPVFLRRQVPA